MIVVDLICAQEHRFEGWFASAEAFASQRESLMVCCPQCGTHDVRRLPSAPHVSRSSDIVAPAAASTDPTSVLNMLMDALHKTLLHSEDVGQAFTVEVRKIHYGDAEARAIKGLATAEETRKLLDEGINVLSLPIAKEDLH